jgi:hypothetical protein
VAGPRMLTVPTLGYEVDTVNYVSIVYFVRSLLYVIQAITRCGP